MTRTDLPEIPEKNTAPGKPAAHGASPGADGPGAHHALWEILARAAREHPDAPAVTFRTEDGGRETVTCAGLWSDALRAGEHWRRAGLRPGDRVLVVLPTSREFVETFFGLLAVGAVAVPFAPPASLARTGTYRETLTAVLSSARPVLCVTTDQVLAAVGGALAEAAPGLRLAVPDRAAAEARPVPADRDGLAMLQYTSGSTSAPKGVALTHGNLLANLEAMQRVLRLGPGDTALSWLPLYHDMGLIGMLLLPLYASCPLVLMPPQAFLKDPAVWLTAAADHEATFTTAPNFAYAYCVRRVDPRRLHGRSLDRLRLALNGAEPVDPDTVRRFEAAFGPFGLRPGTVLPVYGLAESSLAVSFARPGGALADEVDADALERRGEAAAAGAGRRRTLVSVGAPLPTQEVRVADEQGRPLPPRRVGEVLVRGPSVMRGYFEDPEATGTALRDGWLRTGDHGYLAGGELHITGRAKDVVIRRGVNHYPQDFERLAETVPGVREGCTAAFGVEAVSGDGHGSAEEVVLVVETRETTAGGRAEIAAGVRAAISRAYGFPPHDVAVVEPGTVPKTTSGKIRRRACRQRYLASGGGPAAPEARSPRPPASDR